MITGFLVSPDLTHRSVVFELEQANQFLGGVTDERVSVSFQEDGTKFAALYNPDAKSRRAEPNPVASLGRNEAATGNSAFLADPVNAISGPVVFIGAEGQDIALDEIERIKNGIRAVRTYREDNGQEYRLWRAAVLNLGTFQD